jgi:2'-5' RNA ligase
MKMISSMQTGLSNESIKWTSIENLHITLSFLGDTEETVIKNLSFLLNKACTGSGKFELTISGAGIFKSLRDPRVIWTGIEPSAELVALNVIVSRCLEEAAIKHDSQPFKPHLTIGRIRSLGSGEVLNDLLKRYIGVQLQRVHVNEIILYESILHKTGAVYKALEIFTL